MNKFRLFRVSALLVLVLGLVACDDDDITGTGQSLARVEFDAPDAAKTGTTFSIDIRALNVGLSNVRNGRVEVTLGAPLGILSLDASPGTTATFSNGAFGGRITWDLGTLDSNSQSRLTVQTIGVLAPSEGSRTAALEASLTGEGIAAGEAVARDSVTINP